MELNSNRRLIETAEIPSALLRAAFTPESYNAESRTVKVRYTSGAPVMRFDWRNGTAFSETLSTRKGHVRLNRFENGAPVLTDHSWSVRAQVGVILDANETEATIKFSAREEVAPILQDIQDGIIRNISIGYQVHQYEERTKKGDKTRSFEAVDWEPFEISLVAVPADAAAQIRKKETGGLVKGLCALYDTNIQDTGALDEVNARTQKMDDTQDSSPETKVAVEAQTVKPASVKEVRSATEVAGLPDAFALSLVESGLDINGVRAAVLDELSKKRETSPASVRANVSITRDQDDTIKEQVRSAIYASANPGDDRAREQAGDYRGMSLLEIARDCAVRGGVAGARRMHAHELADYMLSPQVRNSHATSDFPLAINTTLGRTLRNAYDENPGTFKAWARRSEINNFQPVARVQLSEGPNLKLKPEGAAYEEGTFGENSEQYKLFTYARKFTVSREMIINDDIGAVARLAASFGASAAARESDLVYSELTANANLSDGVPTFHATHKNLGTAAALAIATMTEAFRLMRLQTGIDRGTGVAKESGRFLGISPKFLLVPAALEGVARQLTVGFTPATTATVNPWYNLLTPIVEPRLDANSATAHYFVAGNGLVDTIEYAYLRGTNGVYTDSQLSFDTDGFSVKARLDFAAKVIDYRGMVKNNGA